MRERLDVQGGGQEEWHAGVQLEARLARLREVPGRLRAHHHPRYRGQPVLFQLLT
ncbi:MAG: hypothetical protein ABR592_03040 [Nitriliruptorales bacterium]